MAKKDRESMEELWSKRFDEEVDYSEEEPMSRKAKREREQSISPILTVTVIFLALLIILPITTYAWYINREVSSEDPSGPNIEQVVQNQEDEQDDEEEPEEESAEEPEEVEEPEETELVEERDEPEAESSEEDTQRAESSVEESEPESETSHTEPATSEPAQSEATESADASESQQSTPPPATEQTSVEEPAQGAEYYTVQAGDNMYRIALNHGMSTEELMQLNNTQDQTVYVGQQLRVR